MLEQIVPVIVAILIGGVAGWMLPRYGGGVFIGAVLGWLVHRAFRQQAAIESLRRRLEQLAALRAGDAAAAAERSQPKDAVQVRDAQPASTPPAPLPAPPLSAWAERMAGEDVTVSPPTSPPPISSSPPASQASPPLPSSQPSPASSPPSSSSRPPPPPPPPSPPPSPLPTQLQRWLLGGNTIVKVGIAILFLGLAFLAKYASENFNVPPELRLSGIGAAALALLAVGWRLRLKRPGYAQVLQGGAVAVLYLTLFVAYRSYHLLDVGAVFALMVAVAALAAALAVLQEAVALAFIGAAGGFAVPLLVSTGSNNALGLFSYYLVLDLGIAAIAWFRTWRSLNLLGFICTFGVGSAWGVLGYDSSHYVTAQSFLIIYFLLFVAILLLPVRRAPIAAPPENARAHRWINGSLLFGLPTIAFALQYGLVREQPKGAALAALGFAAFYTLLAVGLRKRLPLRLVFEGVLAIATVFITLVIPLAFDAKASAGAWALEGAALIWLGFGQSRWLARAFGYALLVLSGGALLMAFAQMRGDVSWLDGAMFSGLMLGAATLFAAWVVQRRAENAIERQLPLLLIGWATLWLLLTGVVHMGHLLQLQVWLAATVTLLSLIAVLYSVLAWRLNWRNIALPVLAFAPLLMFALFWFWLWLWLWNSWAIWRSPLEDGGAVAWPLALLAHLASLRWAAPHWSRAGRHLAHTVGALFLAGWGALEGRALTANLGDGGDAWPWLGWLVAPAALLMWLPRPAAALRWPVAQYPDAYRRSAALILSIALLLWTLLANIGSNGAADPLPYVPLLNPLDIGVAAVLVSVAFWLRSDAMRVDVQRWSHTVIGVLGFVAFVWLNAMLIRLFHHYGGVPFDFDGWTASAAVQAGLTLLWSLIALVLMWLAAHRGWRIPWLVGAALLAVVVLKLLAVDLSGSGSITRIVSFVGAGVLMLVIGYVAPLPRSDAHADGK
ncbi:MAG: DUF2339 domain-containing protein [Nevskiaceae bacterium]|jgi:uncharacterized membrane protein|nr:DUF2339 domain-containing protein [Nevskiaceae bacterium]